MPTSSFISKSLYTSEIWTEDSYLGLTFDVPKGVPYEVKLHFIENYLSAANVGGRVLDITIDKKVKEESIDVLDQVGKNHVLIYTYKPTTKGKKLRVQLDSVKGNPFLAAIEVYPQGAARGESNPDSNVTGTGLPVLGEAVVMKNVPSTAFKRQTVVLTSSKDVKISAVQIEDVDGKNVGKDVGSFIVTLGSGEKVSGVQEILLAKPFKVSKSKGGEMTVAFQPDGKQGVFKVNVNLFTGKHRCLGD